jgi:hypothetical protein
LITTLLPENKVFSLVSSSFSFAARGVPDIGGHEAGQHLAGEDQLHGGHASWLAAGSAAEHPARRRAPRARAPRSCRWGGEDALHEGLVQARRGEDLRFLRPHRGMRAARMAHRPATVEADLAWGPALRFSPPSSTIVHDE